jgi:phytol kinase
MTPLLAALPPFGTLPGELARAAGVAAAFGLLFATAELWARRFHPPVEWTRKYVHVAGGLVSMSLPWLFRWHWTVLALGAGLAVILLIARRFGLLASIHAVERESRGELYFPVGVYLLFLLSHGQPVFYMVSLFTLVVADAVAALLGRSYGRHPFTVGTDRKSIEGSVVFLLAAFLGVHLPLLLMTGIDRGTSVIIAVQLALLVASFEAISTGGNDNLVLPLATYYLLVRLTPSNAAYIAYQLAAQLFILLLVLVLARRTRFLTFSGALAAHLVLYGAFSLGGVAWIVPPALALAAFISLDAIFSRALGMPRGGYQVAAIFYVSIVSVMLLFADNSFATLVPGRHGLGTGHPFHPLFVGSLAAPVAILAFETMESLPRVRRRSALNRALAAASLGFAFVAPLGLWALGGSVSGEGLACAALIDAGALALYLGARRLLRWPPGTVWDLRAVGLNVLVATLLVLPLHFTWLGVAPWSLE